MYNLVTPCTRPENLPKIYNSILAQDYNVFGNLTWWVVFDDSVSIHTSFTFKDIPVIKSKMRVIQLNSVIPGSIAGHGQRNYVLQHLPKDEWFYSIDDDNIIHPQFLSSIDNLIKKDPNAKAVVVSQACKNGQIRLHAAPENTAQFHIDTAQYIFKREIVSQMFEKTDYNADGIFIERLYKENPKAFRFIDSPLCYYNYLREE